MTAPSPPPWNGPPPTVWKRVRRAAVLWLLILSGIYFVVVIVLYLLQPQMLYVPRRQLTIDPGDAGMAFEDVEMAAADGVRLHGWWVPAEGTSRGTVVFCHGNAGNISNRVGSVQVFHELRLDVLIFDYRGYGRSAGSPTEKGTYLDAEAAWDYVTRTRKVPPERIVVFGRSLGGAVAAHLAKERNPRALVLEATFTSVAEVGAAHYPCLPVRLLARFDYAAAEYVKEAKCPVLVIHSPDDEIVPFELGKKVFEAAPGPKKFLEIRGSHNDGWAESGKDYVKGLEAFLSKHLGERGEKK